MKKKLLLLLLALVSALCIAIALPACNFGGSSSGNNGGNNGNGNNGGNNGQTEHAHSFARVAAVEPTCTESGNIEYWFCSGCSTYSTDANGNNTTTLAQVTLNALGHDYIDHDGKVATCTDDGWEAYQTCSRCDYTSYKEITAAGHFPTTAVHENEVEATCIEDGSYDEVVYCSVCKVELNREKKVTKAFGHSWNEWDYVDEKQHSHTCYTCHNTEYSNHQFEDNICSICGYEVTSKLTYILTGSYYTLTGIDSSETETAIVIPSDYEGVPVSAIAPNAFWGNTHITSVAIPASIANIGNNAFQNCTMLKELIIAGEDTIIGADAFLNCNNITTATIPAHAIPYLSGNNIISLTVTSGKIARNSLQTFTKLTTLTAPNITTTLGIIFGDNRAVLKSLTLTECTAIPDNAFYNFTSLNEINLPDNIISIGEEAFYNTAYYNNGANWVFNVCYLDNYLIAANSQISGHYTVTNGTTLIADSAFYECTALTSITIPDSVTSIGSYAFDSCSNLTSIAIPKNVTSIGSRAFYDCNDLKAVYITDLKKWCNIEFKGYYANPLYYAQKLYLNGELVTKLIIPNGVTEIKAYVFYNCNSLTSITIPDSVTSIGDDAFYGCTALQYTEYENLLYLGNEDNPYLVLVDVKDTSLTNYTINPNTKYIYNNAFYNCDSLTSITIPEGVTSIGSYAFYNCDSLTSITIPEGVTSIGGSAFRGCNSLASITIPDSVTSISDYTFSSCINLTSITIPNSVTSIGSHAFAWCYRLTSITIPESVISIGESAFGSCDYLKNVNVNKNNPIYCDIGGVLFSKDKTTILCYPASKNSQYIIPDSVTSIGSYAFYGCTSLTNITIPDSVTSIGSYAFSACTSLTNITIPDSVTSIGSHAFSNCINLTSITIPDSVTSIGEYAFSFCSSLTNITIPNSVTSIDLDAFLNCSNLTSITIPNSVTTITYAFNGSRLTRVYYIGTSEDWGNIKIYAINDPITSATIYYYSETKPTKTGNYWHYVNGVPTVW